VRERALSLQLFQRHLIAPKDLCGYLLKNGDFSPTFFCATDVE
jgi:hypothetical protein